MAKPVRRGAHSISFLTFAREHYWPTVAPTLAEAWRGRAESILEALVSAFGREPLSALTPQRVERWWAELRARGRAGRTDNMELQRLRHLCRRAVKWGYLTDDPTADIVLASEDSERVRFFETPQDRERVLAAANPTLRDFLTIAHYTAARRRSVWALEARDVDLARGNLRFRRPKGQRDLVVPIHPALRPVLERRLAGKGPGDRLFSEYADPHAATRAWRRLCARLGLKDFRLHDWRHDTLSWVAMRTGSLVVAQALAGHATPKMTMRYAHLADGVLRDALQQAL